MKISKHQYLKILNFQKLGAKLSSIKSYIKYKLLDPAHKIGSITQIYYETLKDIDKRHREQGKKNQILKMHLLFLQNKLHSKNKIIKSLLDTQPTALKIFTTHARNEGLWIHAKKIQNYFHENKKTIEEPVT